jgi:hypothetical protein
MPDEAAAAGGVLAIFLENNVTVLPGRSTGIARIGIPYTKL